MNVSLLFVLLSLFSAIPCPTRAQDGKGGRELSFPAYYFFADKRFVNHTIKRVTVKDLDECEYRCYLDANCVSLNIKNKDPTSGTHECELNNSTHLEDNGYLEDNKLFYYRGAENKCGKYREECKNNSTCLSGFTHKGYRCSCITGFEGEHCENDIDECVAPVNPCGAVANSECKNTNGSYNCQCKDGFVKNDGNCEADICKNYQNLTDAERKYDYITGDSPKCDNTLNGWYRFQGAAGTKMVTTCPPTNRCNAINPVWLSDEHPTVAEVALTRKVCIHQFGDCCEKSLSIQVKNCSSYFIYKLRDPESCDTRYCSTD